MVRVRRYCEPRTTLFLTLLPMLAKADMYSYGVVLWELCTLQKPFAGMSSHEHARKVRQALSVSVLALLQ